jgi:hypothetical protein
MIYMHDEPHAPEVSQERDRGREYLGTRFLPPSKYFLLRHKYFISNAYNASLKLEGRENSLLPPYTPSRE